MFVREVRLRRFWRMKPELKKPVPRIEPLFYILKRLFDFLGACGTHHVNINARSLILNGYVKLRSGSAFQHNLVLQNPLDLKKHLKVPQEKFHPCEVIETQFIKVTGQGLP